MSYATTNPPQLLFKTLGAAAGATGLQVWYYKSADTAATVRVSGYFTDGYSRGMRDGDICFVYVTGTKAWSTHTVINASSTTIDLSDATVIGSATNSD